MLLVFVQHLTVSLGWISTPQQRSTACGVFKIHSTTLFNSRSTDNEPNLLVADRRVFLCSIAAIGTTIMNQPITFANAATNDAKANKDDLKSTTYNADTLELFGQDLSTAKWPNTPSPLPTPSKNSDATSTTPQNLEPAASMSDLERALQQAQQKKTVGPLTHG